MFLRAHNRDKDGKRHTYWSIVKTVRTPQGPRQVTLCHLGELTDDAQALWRQAALVHGERRRPIAERRSAPRQTTDRRGLGLVGDPATLLARASADCETE